MDPKTWLFALFSKMFRVLTNQRQMIVASFGFTYIQTALLGCVDGVVTVVTIWTGVEMVARIPNSRAYVGSLYVIPTLLGTFLINALHWDNKVGLLFAKWLVGEVFELSSPLLLLTCAGARTTNFVISLSWLSSVTAGHTKRVTVNAIMLSAYCIGNAAGPFMWQERYKPR